MDQAGKLVWVLYLDKITPGTKRFLEPKGPPKRRGLYIPLEDLDIIGDPGAVEITIRPLGGGD